MPELPFHFRIWPQSAQSRQLGVLYAWNLDANQLRERLIRPYDEGRPITWGGRTVSGDDITWVHVRESSTSIEPPVGRSESAELFKELTDVTNQWITGPPGAASPAPAQADNRVTALPASSRRVMVVHGRNESARIAIFTFLRSLGLEPIEWEDAIAETGMGTPHNLAAVRAAMDSAQAVVVILTAEDQAGLLLDLAVDESDETVLRGQPRQNVVLEAGLAMGVDANRTILVELGKIRRPSDFEGLNVVRLTNAASRRTALRSRLVSAGCDVNERGSDWLDSRAGGDFEACVIDWGAGKAVSPL
jgi:predicted nucleotide-binding protein